uniref:Paired domain-containing protein n=1 Tax=Megaselia scalaris TaxID=36166 RepID=T1GL31_MEGSC
MNAENVAKAVALSAEGRSIRCIALFLNIPKSTVTDALKRYRETGLFTRRPGQGRFRCTSDRDDDSF